MNFKNKTIVAGLCLAMSAGISMPVFANGNKVVNQGNQAQSGQPAGGQTDPKTQPAEKKLDVSQVLGTITVDDILNNAGKMNIKKIDELTKEDIVIPSYTLLNNDLNSTVNTSAVASVASTLPAATPAAPAAPAAAPAAVTTVVGTAQGGCAAGGSSAQVASEEKAPAKHAKDASGKKLAQTSDPFVATGALAMFGAALSLLGLKRKNN